MSFYLRILSEVVVVVVVVVVLRKAQLERQYCGSAVGMKRILI